MMIDIEFGAFIPPFYTPEQNPTVVIDEEIEFIKFLEKKGFSEAWIGEHHSGGHELISSPEIFIATAATHTSHIKLGTGVISLAYHHPLLVADRMVLLDHLTKGRVMLGVGPGALVADAYMMGIDPLNSRDIMSESLGVIHKLLKGETVTFHNDTFTLKEAKLHLMPWSKSGIEIAVAGVNSDAGPSLAGLWRSSLISAGNLKKVKHHWDVYANSCPGNYDPCLRKKWRIASPLFLAETKDIAIEKTRVGLIPWLKYFQNATTLKLIDNSTKHEEAVEIVNKSGFGVIGTYQEARLFIEKLFEVSGGFGKFLATKHSWANNEDIINSYKIISEKLIPYFSSMTVAQQISSNWLNEKSDEFISKMNTAILNKSTLMENK